MTPPDPTMIEQTLDQAWNAFESGAPDSALAELNALERQTAGSPHAGYLAGERARLAVEAHLALLNLAGAQAALATCIALLPSAAHPIDAAAPEDEHHLMIARGELALASWDLPAAQAAFQAILDMDHFDGPFRIAHDRLALIADLDGRYDQADTHFAAAQGRPPVRMTSEDFEAQVAHAIEHLPPEFQVLFERIPLVLDDMPTRDLAAGSGQNPLEVPADVLGLFLGASDLDQSGFDFPSAPAHIRLFQRNLERIADSPEHLAEEITTTLYHELGHALGYDEDGVDALGLH